MPPRSTLLTPSLTLETSPLRFAVEALNNRYKSAEGYEAPLNRPQVSPCSEYRSQAELPVTLLTLVIRATPPSALTWRQSWQGADLM